MKNGKRFFIHSGIVILLLSIVLGGLSIKALEKEDLRRGLQAVVKLVILDANDSIAGTCSGTVLNTEGYILTNFHCVGQTDLYGEDPNMRHGELFHPEGLLGVAITENARFLPVPSYIAQYITGNPDQDIAVIKIVSDLEGNKIADTLPLLTTKLVDSDLVDIADEVSVLGYPGVGGDTVTFTEGKISGFLDDDGDRIIDWFKTDALVNGGNSGGTAINDDGDMFAIPSAKLFEEGDTIYFLKPVNHAVPLIERAMQAGGGEVEIGGSPGTTGGTIIADDENFGEITFGTGYSNGRATGQGTVFPSGTTEVHAAIPYQNMRNGSHWSYMWYYDGQEIVGESDLRWSLENTGVLDLYIYQDDGLPEGRFDLEVLLGSKIMQEGSVVVGDTNPNQKAAPEPPSFGQESPGVTLSGLIVDYDTEEGIEGAVILFLIPGKTIDDFDEADDIGDVIISGGVADYRGYYNIEPPLPRGETYSVLVGKKGYQRIAYDDALDISEDDPDWVEMEEIALEKW